MRTRAILGILALCAVAGGCGKDSSGVEELQVVDLVVGTGQEVIAGGVVSLDYTGWLYDEKQAEKKGRQFDTSVGGQPLQFTVGVGAVITGFDRGLLGMRVGGKRRLVIPSDLAYGSAGAGAAIPPNASLVFEVTLIGVNAS
jgi:FKBP-type peptidyl-prolyl cis-trans isomerase FkpA